ncbi:hypothetical protein CYFUS_009815 [Cystobacter fuscus]|uniref:Uncharacterized protein n=1 Tax=Cystobacter fuscus TaxID=43 RepID=A0A250JL17_9BACT|nr:hypothetical protein [Cystobacter fuscus]ATB44328.1 hypothetical protein CYFUS_009815 [Cystobacter fuscus]
MVTLASTAAWASEPSEVHATWHQVPFEAKAVRRLDLFRSSALKREDLTNVAAGTVVTVLAMVGEKSWEGKPEQVVKVALDSRTTDYTFLSQLEPLGASERLSADDASALLFSQVPKSRREWCAQFARRLLLSSRSPRTLTYSGSPDSDCAGYLALVSGIGKSARVLAHTRRQALQSITLHEFASAPAVLDVTESLRRTERVNGIGRFFLSLRGSTFQELLSVDLRRDELEGPHKRSSLAEVEVKPSEQGLDIEVRQTQLRTELATGVESNLVHDTLHYRYAGGKLSAWQPRDAK